MYGSKQGRLDSVPMNDIGPGYAPIDEQRNVRNKPPAGAVPLFPNMMPVSYNLKHALNIYSRIVNIKV